MGVINVHASTQPPAPLLGLRKFAFYKRSIEKTKYSPLFWACRRMLCSPHTTWILLCYFYIDFLLFRFNVSWISPILILEALVDFRDYPIMLFIVFSNNIYQCIAFSRQCWFYSCHSNFSYTLQISNKRVMLWS